MKLILIDSMGGDRVEQLDSPKKSGRILLAEGSLGSRLLKRQRINARTDRHTIVVSHLIFLHPMKMRQW